MKLIAWALGTLFAVWLAAFVGIKIYDLNCVANPSVCFTETGIWLRKFVLLEWASKWQTLLAGIFVLSGGISTIFAARLEIKFSESKEFRQKRDEIIAHASYLSELFLRSSFLQSVFDEKKDMSQWTDVVSSIKYLSPVHPGITGDMLQIWSLLNRFADGDNSEFTMVQIRGMSACANCVLKDILEFYQSGGIEYNKKTIKASTSLVSLLEQFEHSLQPPLHGSSILALIRPMNNYIDFSGTELERKSRLSY